MDYVLDSSTIEAHGLTFKVEIKQDNDSGKPWAECEGFGPVREAEKGYYDRYLTKKPGERVLHLGDRNCYSWVYDWQGATALAKRDGWGVSPEHRPDNWDALTAKQQRGIAVQRDFDFLKAWCDEDWVWSGVCVTLLIEDEDGDLAPYDGDLDLSDSLFSVEFWQYKNLDDAKNSHAKSIVTEMVDRIAKAYHAEQAERLACEERDIVTVAA